MTASQVEPKTGGCCSSGAGGPCDWGPVRVNYAHGMLLDEHAFQAEQLYQRDRTRAILRSLVGSGVVSGLAVVEGQEGRLEVVVRPGVAIDGAGNLLELHTPLTVSLADVCKAPKKAKGPCPPEGDPTKEVVRWICLRYVERRTQPVPTYVPDGSGCDPTCVHSRVQEGVCVEVTDEECVHPTCCTPEAGVLTTYWRARTDVTQCGEDVNGAGDEAGKAAAKEALTKELCCAPVPGLCGGQACVVLGKVTVRCCPTKDENGEEKKPIEIDLCDPCRTTVWSAALIRHMACTLLAGIENVCTEGGSGAPGLPTATQVAQQPMEALCKLLAAWLAKGAPTQENDSAEFNPILISARLAVLEKRAQESDAAAEAQKKKKG